MTYETWLARHPYLRPMADVRAFVDAAAARVVSPATAGEPDWQVYQEDFKAGVPLLDSTNAAIGVSDPSSVVRSMLAELRPMPLPPVLAKQCLALETDLQTTSDEDRGPVDS